MQKNEYYNGLPQALNAVPKYKVCRCLIPLENDDHILQTHASGDKGLFRTITTLGSSITTTIAGDHQSVYNTIAQGTTLLTPSTFQFTKKSAQEALPPALESNAFEVFCAMLSSCGCERYFKDSTTFESFVRSEYFQNPKSLISQVTVALLAGHDVGVTCPRVTLTSKENSIAEIKDATAVPLISFGSDSVMVDLPSVDPGNTSSPVTHQEDVTGPAPLTADDDLFFPTEPSKAAAVPVSNSANSSLPKDIGWAVSLLPQIYIATLWPFMLHIASQPVLDYHQGPLGLVICASQQQTAEVHRLLEPIAEKLQLLVHNAFLPVPLMPPTRRADIVIGTALRIASLIPTNASHAQPDYTSAWPCLQLPDQCPANMSPAVFNYYSLAYVCQVLVFSDTTETKNQVPSSNSQANRRNTTFTTTALSRILSTTNLKGNGSEGFMPSRNKGIQPSCQLIVVTSKDPASTVEIMRHHTAKPEVVLDHETANAHQEGLGRLTLFSLSSCDADNIDWVAMAGKETQSVGAVIASKRPREGVEGQDNSSYKCTLTLHNVSTVSRWLQIGPVLASSVKQHPLTSAIQEEINEWALRASGPSAEVEVGSVQIALTEPHKSVVSVICSLTILSQSQSSTNIEIEVLLADLCAKFDSALIDGLHPVVASAKVVEVVGSSKQVENKTISSSNLEGWQHLLNIPLPFVDKCDLKSDKGYYILIRNLLPRLGISIFGHGHTDRSLSAESALNLAREPLSDIISRLYVANPQLTGAQTSSDTTIGIGGWAHHLLHSILQSILDSGNDTLSTTSGTEGGPVLLKASFFAKSTVVEAGDDGEGGPTSAQLEVGLCVAVPSLQLAINLAQGLQGQSFPRAETKSGFEGGQLLQFFVASEDRNGKSLTNKTHIALFADPEGDTTPANGTICCTTHLVD